MRTLPPPVWKDTAKPGLSVDVSDAGQAALVRQASLLPAMVLGYRKILRDRGVAVSVVPMDQELESLAFRLGALAEHIDPREIVEPTADDVNAVQQPLSGAKR